MGWWLVHQTITDIWTWKERDGWISWSLFIECAFIAKIIKLWAYCLGDRSITLPKWHQPFRGWAESRRDDALSCLDEQTGLNTSPKGPISLKSSSKISGISFMIFRKEVHYHILLDSMLSLDCSLDRWAILLWLIVDFEKLFPLP